MSNNVYIFEPQEKVTARENLERFISYSKNRLTAFGVDSWNNNLWHTYVGTTKVTARYSTNTKPSNSYHFEPIEAPLLDFAKAYIRYTFAIKPVSNLQRHFEAIRVLEEALLDVHGRADILLLDGVVLEHISTVLKKRITNLQSRNKAGYQMELLLNFCRENMITLGLPVWTNPFSRIKDLTISLDENGQEYRSNKLPSDEEMMFLAKLFHDAPQLGIEEEFFTSIMAILMCAPGRASEVLNLGTDALVWEEDRAGNRKLGIAWFPAKNGKAGIKWVPTIMQDVIVEAFERLKRIGQPARYAAEFAEMNPGRFWRHSACTTPVDFADTQELTLVQLSSAINIKLNNDTDIIKKSWLSRIYVSNGQKITYQALGKYLWKLYSSKFPNWPYIDKNRKVKVSNALCLHREYEFHKDFSRRNFSFMRPTVNTLNDRFAASTASGKVSLWKKHGFSKADGSAIRMKTHMPRHWLSTKAEQGGADELLLANWAGRARIADNRSYDHRTELEKARQAAAITLSDNASVLDKIQCNIPVSFKDIGKTLPGAAIVTELGVCEHDFTMMPCQRNGSCLICKELVCIKGFSSSLKLLKRKEKQESLLLQRARRNRKQRTFGSDRWVDQHLWRLLHITAKIRLLEDTDVPSGTPLRMPELYDPSPVKELLQSKNKSLDVPSSESKMLQELALKLLGED